MIRPHTRRMVMATPVDEWDRLIARIRTEADVIVPYDDIPHILAHAAFSAQFGKIDARALHAP